MYDKQIEAIPLERINTYKYVCTTVEFLIPLTRIHERITTIRALYAILNHTSVFRIYTIMR